jgi:Tfp pilus assembly protein PilZ
MQSEESYIEQRRHARVSAAIDVRISTIEPDRDPWTGRPVFRASAETCANLSRGGAYVRTDQPLAPGRRILMELSIPDGSSFEAIGRVAWSRRITSPGPGDAGSGIGIEFLGAAADHFQALEEFIAHRDEESATMA